MSQTIAIEPIGPENAASLKQVRLAALAEAPTAFGSALADEARLTDDDWQRRAEHCSSPTSAGWLAMEGARACGIVRGEIDEEDPDVWVESMWVDPAHRRAGIGRMLVEQVLDWARRRGVRGAKLEVTSDNEPAIRLYESLGFRMTGQARTHPRFAGLQECQMWRPLEPASAPEQIDR